jgi:hypothetical protein
MTNTKPLTALERLALALAACSDYGAAYEQSVFSGTARWLVTGAAKITNAEQERGLGYGFDLRRMVELAR